MNRAKPRSQPTRSGRRRSPASTLPLAGIGMAALGVAVLAAVLVARPDYLRSPKVVVDARSQSPFVSCLLTDQAGVGRAPASQVWAGIQDAAAATGTRANFLPVIGKAGRGNATGYLNTLLAQRCNVVAAVGTAPSAAVAAVAAMHPTTHFLVLGARAQGSANPVVIATSTARSDARAYVLLAVRGR
jgi:hypothetical protein